VPLAVFMLMVGCAGYGAMLVMNGVQDVGVLFLAGTALLFCAFLCTLCMAAGMFKMIDLTELLLRAVMDFVSKKPSMVIVSLTGVATASCWIVAVSMAGMGLVLEYQERYQPTPGSGSHMVIELLWFFVATWGAMIMMNTTIVAYAGVFGRIYFGKEGPVVRPSLTAAFTTSFGSICLGSLIVAAVRTLEHLAKMIEQQAEREDNTVLCIISWVIRCCVRCIGDIIEYFNAWAYIQCAIRNSSFGESVKITWSLCTCANVQYIMAESMVEWVAALGVLITVMIGWVVGGVMGYSMSGGDMGIASVSASFAVATGACCGLAICGIIDTGAKSLVVLWAEDPAPFEASHPSTHKGFEEKILGNLQQPASNDRSHVARARANDYS